MLSCVQQESPRISLFDDYAKHCAGGTLILQEGIRVHWRIMEKMKDEIARDICKK